MKVDILTNSVDSSDEAVYTGDKDSSLRTAVKSEKSEIEVPIYWCGANRVKL